MSNQCDHGHLRRVCEICQRDDEIKQLKAERDALLATLPGAVYLDPPDGGDVDVVEQFSRMAKDAERYRRLRMATREQLNDLRDAIFWGAEYLDAAIDAARSKT